jgi:hypothetical protein
MTQITTQHHKVWFRFDTPITAMLPSWMRLQWQFQEALQKLLILWTEMSPPLSSWKLHFEQQQMPWWWQKKGTRATTTTMSTRPPKLLCILFQYTTACCQELNGTNSGWSSYPSPPSSPFSVFSSNTQGACFQELVPIREDHHQHHQHSRSL